MSTPRSTGLQYAPPGLTHAQFISCYTVPGAKGSTQKISCDAHGNAWDAHDPKLWSTAADVMARPWKIGFVLTREIRVLFVDLDKCWDAERGCWKPIVDEVLAWFPGAYVEVSNSGTGIHIMFMGDVPDGHRCKNAALGIEIYSERRFVLLTGLHARGRVDIDFSDRMPAFLAKYGLDPEPLPPAREGGRSPLWQGPEDDDALIALMLAQGQRSALGAFQGKATAAQVWNMDVAALTASWGTEGRSDGLPFDHSSVDMAMMSHLAYFTGGDEPRMVRIFERWPGYRAWKYARRGGYHIRRTLARANNNPRVLGERLTTLIGGPAQASPPVVDPATGAVELKGRFLAYMPNHTYYDTKTGEFWPAASVDDLIPPIAVGTKMGGVGDITIKATKWLAQNRGVDQRTWFPGQPPIIEGVIRDGEIILSPGQRILNTYRPPSPVMGNAHDIEPWRAHVQRLYPTTWGLIIRWMAYAAQNPGQKINHALVLGGGSRIGKDTILEPLLRAIGEWNVSEVSPETILKSNHNDYLECRLLRISEAKDTGGESRYQFYDKTKTIIAAPPRSHRINPKNFKPYVIPNLNNTAITTNYKVGGMYIAPDDGRHSVHWSEARRGVDGLDDAYFNWLYGWFANGGLENCATYLMTVDISDFNPKALPFKTQAFYEMVEGGQSREHHELADVVGLMNGHPFTLEKLAGIALMEFNDRELADWIKNKANGTKIARSLNEIGVIQHRNPADVDRGRWYDKEKKRPITFYIKPG